MLDLKRCAERPIADEFADAELGDVRRTRRLQRIASAAMRAPDVGFPRMVDDDSELEGFYRFFSSESVTPEAVLEPHLQATVARMLQAPGPVLVAHDTTDLRFGGEGREGLGLTNGDQRGFFLHVALAILPGEERLALGTCGVMRLLRPQYRDPSRRGSDHISKDPNRESRRWSELLEQVEDRCEDVDCIHLMDREGDHFDLLALMQRRRARFIVRGRIDRLIEPGLRLDTLLGNLQPVAHRTIDISERPDKGRTPSTIKKHPSRNGRAARIAVAGCAVTLPAPRRSHDPTAELCLNVVRVWEPDPPPNEPAVSWTLYTTEPVDSAEQLLAIVDYYRSRWVVEEFFKALKTGCAIEKRQLETYDALSVALAVFLPIAWRLLLARSISRMQPTAPASTVATDVQLQLLRHKLKLKDTPATAQEATYAIARLGGHLKRNGAPGWITLGRGFETLLLMEAGWRAAVSAQRSDQS
jgi:hypothetical protein